MENTLVSDKRDVYPKGFKFAAVLVAAFSTGFLWRARGDSGWGSMWGMLAVSAVLSLLIYFVFGYRKKAQYEFLVLTTFGTAATVGGWGTLNDQMSGIIRYSTQVDGVVVKEIIEINPLSGLTIMLLLGFCWMPFFAYLMGRFFSGRQYSLRDFIVPVLVFYGVMLIFKATLAHPIFHVINPQAVDIFRDGLIEQGLEPNAWFAYLRHFDSDPWAKTIEGGRNYFTSVEVVASAFGTLGVWIYQRFILKDKVGGRINLSVNIVMALAITIADIFMVLRVKEGILGHLNTPTWITTNAWSLWEFFTGFLLGLGLMLLFFVADKKTQVHSDVEDKLPKLSKKVSFAYHSLLTIFYVLFLSIIRPLVERLMRTSYTLTGKQIFYSASEYNDAISAGTDPASIFLFEGKLPSSAVLYIIFIALALLVSLLIVNRNIFKNNLKTPVNMPFADFCALSLLFYFTAVVFMYFLTGNMYLVHSQKSIITLLMIVSAIITYFGLSFMLFLKYRQGRNSVKSE